MCLVRVVFGRRTWFPPRKADVAGRCQKRCTILWSAQILVRLHFSASIEDLPRIICFLWKGRSGPLPMTIELAPSILSANFARLGEEAKAALDGGGTVLHVDVMDGHFVPNITIGPLVVASLRKALPNAILDCHLMIENPDEFIPAFAEAGASWISVHQEACVHLHRTLQLIESHGCKP